MREGLVVRDRHIRFTRFELEVMRELWGLGRASIKELQDSLPEPKRVAYTTVQTIVYRLEKKGAVRRAGKAGNAHVFEPLVKRQAAHRRLVEELLNLFGGSARPLMAHLAESGKLSLDDLREAEELLARVDKVASLVPPPRGGTRKRAVTERRKPSARK
jgi:predicted transcriptional regulator